MQVGSLVVVLPLHCRAGMITPAGNVLQWLPIDDGKTEYVLRSRTNNGTADDGWTFEEGIVGINKATMSELGIKEGWLKEVQPPMSIEELIEESIYVLI